jgi:hypothetical protein
MISGIRDALALARTSYSCGVGQETTTSIRWNSLSSV